MYILLFSLFQCEKQVREASNYKCPFTLHLLCGTGNLQRSSDSVLMKWPQKTSVKTERKLRGKVLNKGL